MPNIATNLLKYCMFPAALCYVSMCLMLQVFVFLKNAEGKIIAEQIKELNEMKAQKPFWVSQNLKAQKPRFSRSFSFASRCDWSFWSYLVQIKTLMLQKWTQHSDLKLLWNRCTDIYKHLLFFIHKWVETFWNQFEYWLKAHYPGKRKKYYHG